MICLLLIVGAAGLLSGCGKDSGEQTGIKNYSEESQESRTEEEGAVREENGKESRDESAVRVTPTSEITELATGLSMVRYEGEYGFDTFLEQGGTASDGDVAAYITSPLALWYSDHVEITDTKLHGIKALRECSDVVIRNCDIISPEFGWSTRGIRMEDTTAVSEYFMMRSEDLIFRGRAPASVLLQEPEIDRL